MPLADAEDYDDSEVAQGLSQPQQQRRRYSDTPDDALITQAVGNATQGSAGHVDQQMVKKLVRLALACEYSRTPIRRSDVNAKVLGPQTRQFKNVFSAAQLQLRAVFGMEMTELPLREKVTLAQRRAAQKSQSVQKTSSAWILTTVLPSRFRLADIVSPPQVPTAEAESQYCALYTFVISLIFLSGGTLPDGKLDRYLKRVNVDETTPFTGAVAFNGMDKTEKLLKRMEKDGYVVRIRDTSTGEEIIEWIVGPRGKVEVGERGVTGVVKKVYGGLEEDEAADLDRRVNRSLGLRETMTQAA
ncbi:hypothetical protein AAFC00_007152 [Neodothiora populina]|uniref:MAGE domain-containing protein n=1 Tax=Neodothiora populina TaxID=2781224 RepID=A0ABR3PHL3_9PEZI